MLTKNDAIKVGKVICDVARRIGNDSNKSDYHLTLMGRGTCIYAMDGIWQDVVPLKIKYPHGQDNLSVYTKDQWYRDCGWPE